MAIDSKDKREILNDLMNKQSCRCYYCKRYCFMGTIEQRIDKDRYPDIATIEHLLPKGMQGRNNRKYLVMACNQCNNKLGTIKNAKKVNALK